jgi:hypothetical protein
LTDQTPFTAECGTCGDQSDSEPGLVCGRMVHPSGEDDHPNATPCTGTYQPLQPDPKAAPANPATWRGLFTAMTPAMWWRLAALGVVAVVSAVMLGVGVVQSLTGY